MGGDNEEVKDQDESVVKEKPSGESNTSNESEEEPSGGCCGGCS